MVARRRLAYRVLKHIACHQLGMGLARIAARQHSREYASQRAMPGFW